MCTFLTNWRYGPILLVVGTLFIVRSYLMPIPKRRLFLTIGAMVLGAGLIFLIIVFKYFKFDFLLYYQHFFGFYKDFGEKLFFREFLIPQVKGLLFVFVLLILYLVNLIKNTTSRPFRIELVFWTGGLSFIYITTSIAFYLNGAGGGFYYHYPLLIYLWFMFLRYYDSIKIPKALFSPITIVLLLVSNTVQSALPPLFGMKDAWEKAEITRNFLQDLNEKHLLWTEDIFLFKNKWSGETIDMGDYDSFYRNSGLFPLDFNNLVDAHFEELKKNPPEAVVLSAASSPELHKFILANNYLEVYRYSGWENMDFGIWFRPDFRIPTPKISQ
jgi:hypothetical protein